MYLYIICINTHKGAGHRIEAVGDRIEGVGDRMEGVGIGCWRIVKVKS